MAPTSYAIDPEWTESLVGRCIAVPLSWWPGYSGTELLLGKLAEFDRTASPMFLLEVDDESGNTYAMQYDAVLAYAQVEHPTFKNSRLPNTVPEEPAPDDTVVLDVGAVARDAVASECGRHPHCLRWPPRPIRPATTAATTTTSVDFDRNDKTTTTT